MDNKTKQEAIKIIDQLLELRKELTELEDKRRKVTADLDKAISQKYNEMSALEEKKRCLLDGSYGNNESSAVKSPY